jgi:patatin-like phospholipase/acyl hydrolase
MFYRILALDGGGLRSIYSAQILFRLHDQYRILDKVDMLAGVSGGAIVAAGLACGWSPSQIVDFFFQDGPDIFERTVYPGVIDELAYLRRSKYGTGRYTYFKKYFGDKRLEDYRKRIVIPSFDTRHKSGLWQPISFSNFPGSPLRSERFLDAVMSSTAAPIYFPVNQFGETKYIDGGLWANNPADAALAEALRSDHGGVPFDKICILSIGTTQGKMILDSPKNNMGLLDWFQSGVVDLLTDAGAKLAIDYKLRSALGPRYCRVDEIIDNPIDLDEISAIPRLVRLANEYDIEPVGAWLQGFW